MTDVQCPHCGAEQEINHDDGYGYEEDTEHSQYCENCDSDFTYITSIMFSYNVYCDKGRHRLETPRLVTTDSGNKFRYSTCEKCDYREVTRVKKDE